MTHIDTPQLHTLSINFFSQIDFDCPRLAQFLNRIPTLKLCDEARVEFSYITTNVILRYWTSGTRSHAHGLLINISSDPQLSPIKLVCNSSFHPLSTVKDLYIWSKDIINNTLWLEHLRPFTAVKNLYVTRILAPDIAALQELIVMGRMTEVLPSLIAIFVEEIAFQGHIGPFIVAQRLSDHPITISVWDTYSDLEWV